MRSPVGAAIAAAAAAADIGMTSGIIGVSVVGMAAHFSTPLASPSSASSNSNFWPNERPTPDEGSPTPPPPPLVVCRLARWLEDVIIIRCWCASAVGAAGVPSSSWCEAGFGAVTLTGRGDRPAQKGDDTLCMGTGVAGSRRRRPRSLSCVALSAVAVGFRSTREAPASVQGTADDRIRPIDACGPRALPPRLSDALVLWWWCRRCARDPRMDSTRASGGREKRTPRTDERGTRERIGPGQDRHSVVTIIKRV